MTTLKIALNSGSSKQGKTDLAEYGMNSPNTIYLLFGTHRNNVDTSNIDYSGMNIMHTW